MQNSTYPFAPQNNINEFLMYAGDYQNLSFDVYTSACAVVSLNAASVVWELRPYGTTIPILTKTGIISASPVNRFHVYLDSTDSESLNGKYTQTYYLTDSSGSTFRPTQGLVTIVG